MTINTILFDKNTYQTTKDDQVSKIEECNLCERERECVYLIDYHNNGKTFLDSMADGSLSVNLPT